MWGEGLDEIEQINLSIWYESWAAPCKNAFGHMTEKAQISLHICSVWSGPTLSANRIIKY